MGKAGLPLWALSAALGLGIFLGFETLFSLQSAFIFVLVTGLCLALTWSLPRRIHPYGYLLIALLSFFGYGGLTASLEHPKNQKAHFWNQLPAQELVRASRSLSETNEPLRQTSAPASAEIRFTIRLKSRQRPTIFSRPWIGEIQGANGRTATGLILLQFPVNTPDHSWISGDTIEVCGIPIPFDPPRNPGGFDFGSSMRNQGVWLQLQVQNTLFRHRAGASNFSRRLIQWRLRLHRQLQGAGLSEEATGLFSALILGERGGITPELRQAYQRSGTAHLLAISGLHVGLVLILIRLLLRPLLGMLSFRLGVLASKGRRLLLFTLSILGLWGFSALAGFGASVVRASCMLSLWLIAELFYRQGQSLHFLGLAAMIMLAVINPHWVLQPGFQLSFGAVWGILAFFPLMTGWLSYGISHFVSPRTPGIVTGILKKTASLAGVSLSAQLGVFPVALFHFHQFPWHFLVGSLLLVPFLGILLSVGFALLAASSLGAIASGLAWLAETLLKLQHILVRKLAAQEAFLVTGIRWDSGHLLITYVLLISLALTFQKLRPKQRPTLRMPRSYIRLTTLTGILLLLYDLQVEIAHQRVRELWIPHQTAASGLWLRQGNFVLPYAENQDDWSQAVEAYTNSTGLDIMPHKELTSAYVLDNARLLRLSAKDPRLLHYLRRLSAADSAVRNPDVLHSDKPLFLLLSHSPRGIDSTLLQRLKPKIVIADGSNYYSALDRWQELCTRLNIPFHTTAKQGAFRIELDNPDP